MRIAQVDAVTREVAGLHALGAFAPHVEEAEAVRAAQVLGRAHRHRVDGRVAHIELQRAYRLRAIDQQKDVALAAQFSQRFQIRTPAGRVSDRRGNHHARLVVDRFGDGFYGRGEIGGRRHRAHFDAVAVAHIV